MHFTEMEGIEIVNNTLDRRRNYIMVYSILLLIEEQRNKCIAMYV